MAVTPHTYALTDLDTVKEHLNIPLANTAFDDQLQRFINAATDKVENYTDRKILKRAYTEYQDGRGNNRTLLDQWPADKPTEVWTDSSGLFTDTNNQVETADFELEFSARSEGMGVVLLGGRTFPKGTRNLKFVYEAGYATVPDDLENATIWLVEFWYDLRNDRRIGLESKGKNQETTRYHGNLPPIVLDVLDRYRRCEWPTGIVAVRST